LTGNILSRLFQPVVDFLIEDRCVLCGEISRASSQSVEPSGQFTKYLARAVHERAIGFIQIENHPLCHACLSGFDETVGSGVIHLAGIAPASVEEAEGTAVAPSDNSSDTPHPAPQAPEPAQNAASLSVIAPFMTNDPVLGIVHKIKFSAYTALVPLMSRSLQAAFAYYRNSPADSHLLIPVPMHPRQLKERGFNQAELIALELAGGLNIPLRTDLLGRKRPGRRQSSTPREKRPANVRGVFCAKKGALTGKHALLVDDLVTTGATAAACATELLAAGAVSVTVLCLGRSL
jgi:ComF family protein